MIRALIGVFLGFLLFSCDHTKPSNDTSSVPPPPPPPPPPVVHEYRYEVFQVVDSTGAGHGVGYDIYDHSKKLIHQTTIPGEQGIEGFANEAEASKVAELVVSKLEKAEGFPTISRDELTALGITLQKK